MAWSGSLSGNGLVYDACFALGEDGSAAPVCGLPCGDVSEKGSCVGHLSVDAPFIILTGSRRRPIAQLEMPQVPATGREPLKGMRENAAGVAAPLGLAPPRESNLPVCRVTFSTDSN